MKRITCGHCGSVGGRCGRERSRDRERRVKRNGDRNRRRRWSLWDLREVISMDDVLVWKGMGGCIG